MSSPVKLNTNSSPSASISAAQSMIGLTTAALLNVGLLFLGFASLGGAFFPGCPFRSAFSSVIRFIFEKPQTLLKWILHGERNREVWIVTLTLLCPVPVAAIVFVISNAAHTTGVGIWSSLIFLAAASFPLAVFAKLEVVHKPQKYKIPHLALWVFLPNSVVMIIAILFDQARIGGKLMWMIISGVWGLFVLSVVLVWGGMSKSMADTGEIDAISWLLKTAPPQNSALAASFKKAAQMTGIDSIGCDYRPRLLESLIPFLSLLIISHQAPEHPSSATPSPSSNPSFDEDPHLKNLEIYTACLARLSEFTDSKGSFKYLWEDAKQHPKLEQALIDKLVTVVLANPQDRSQDGLRSAATKVLKNYELDMEGKSVGGPTTIRVVGSHGVGTVLRKAGSSVATILGNAASWMLNVIGLNLNSRKKQRRRSDESRLGRSNSYELSYHPVDLVTPVQSPHSFLGVEQA
jgi:hypothetical protein